MYDDVSPAMPATQWAISAAAISYFLFDWWWPISIGVGIGVGVIAYILIRGEPNA